MTGPFEFEISPGLEKTGRWFRQRGNIVIDLDGGLALLRRRSTFQSELAETSLDKCRPGEGPPAGVPDPEGYGLHPLVYRGTTARRSRNPTVGDVRRHSYNGEVDEGLPPVSRASPRTLTYTQKDVIDNRISIPAQHSLVRLSKNPATNARAVGLLGEVKAGRLAGIYCANWLVAAQRAVKLGKSWWTVFPAGEDSVLLLDPANPTNGRPLIAYRRELDPDCGLLKGEKRFTASPQRLDAALLKAGASYELWNASRQPAQLTRCTVGDRTTAELEFLGGARPLGNVIPTLLCQVRGQPAASAECAKNVDEIIRGWGQYSDNVDELSQDERDKIEKLADAVVTSFTVVGCPPLGQITIIGHADKDFQGAALEKKVSEERATSVSAALATAIMRLWNARKMGPFRKGAIAFGVSGVGATQPDAANVPVVTNRLLNRRVEIRIRQFGPPVPPPDTCQRRIARFLELLATKNVDPDPKGARTRRARCILGKLCKPGVLDVFVDGTAANQTVGPHRVPGNLCSFLGNYDPPELSIPDFAKFLGTVSLVLKGPGFAPTVSDAQILKGLSALIDMINQGIVRVEQYITQNSSDFGYTGDKTRGRRLSSIFADHLDDQNSIYSCYKDFHGGE